MVAAALMPLTSNEDHQMPKLNDTQSLLLAHAANSATGSFLPLPDSHIKGGARVTKALTQLLGAGLAEERETSDAPATYRADGDLRFGLFITPAGLAAIGIEPEQAAPAATSDVEPPAQPPARQTKSALVLGLLQRPEGATLAELIAVTGWLPHTTRAALTGLRKKGHEIAKDKRDGVTRYTVASA
jgi:hypothetical protein